MADFQDKEFGDITVRRSALSKHIKVSLAPNGTLRVSMPAYAPLFLAKRLIASSRGEIRALREKSQTVSYTDGMQIGKSHHLSVIDGSSISVKQHGQMIHVSKPESHDISDAKVQSVIRTSVIKALRKEAKSYLPRRLEFLAQRHEYTYTSVRFSHASSRWGSCSSQGVISLNIALMKLPFEEIDYVLVHELAHTKEMNHSERFWRLVESMDAQYKVHRKNLKNETPSI